MSVVQRTAGLLLCLVSALLAQESRATSEGVIRYKDGDVEFEGNVRLEYAVSNTPSERRYAFDGVLPPAPPVAPASRPTKHVLPEPRMNRDDEVGPVERYLTERLRAMSGIGSFRFEDTTVRSYGGADAENPRWFDETPPKIVRWVDRAAGGQRRRELVTFAQPSLHAVVSNLLSEIEASPPEPISFQVRLLAVPRTGPAADSARVLTLDAAEARARLKAPQPPGSRVLVEGVVQAGPRSPGRADKLRTRAFVVDYDAPQNADASTPPSPIVEHVPEGARVSIAPVLVRSDGSGVDLMLGFDLAQILKPIRTFETTLEKGGPIKVELPDTNETTWRSNILTIVPGKTAISVDRIRWLSVDPEGMFDLELLVVADDGPPFVGWNHESIYRDAPMVLALGADDTAVVGFGRVDGSAPKKGERLRVVREGSALGLETKIGEAEVVRVEGMVMFVKRLSGPPLAIRDRLVP
jgi:hypothetical protein